VHPASRSLLARWIYAAKLASWPKLLVPTLLGQAIGVTAVGRLDTHALLLGVAFTICDLLFVVFVNDWGDRRVDRIKRQMFPEGSAKTIPDGILPASTVLGAGIVAGLAALIVAQIAGASLGRPGLVLAAAGLLAIFVAYTLPPIRLNYRGGGELLEALGVGVALPCFHVYMQSGVSWTAGMWLLPGFALLAYASAIASGLADEQSDRRGGKRTYASEYGNRAARALIERLVLGACLVWAIGMRIAGVLPAPLGAIAVIVVLVNWRRLRKLSPAAKTNAFEMHARYKHLLHNAIWRSAAIVALALIVVALVRG
jgi:1,4-dihydroxy-2-naphthoate octaprenyltransferase/chlorophyll synthase